MIIATGRMVVRFKSPKPRLSLAPAWPHVYGAIGMKQKGAGSYRGSGHHCVGLGDLQVKEIKRRDSLLRFIEVH